MTAQSEVYKGFSKVRQERNVWALQPKVSSLSIISCGFNGLSVHKRFLMHLFFDPKPTRIAQTKELMIRAKMINDKSCLTFVVARIYIEIGVVF